MEAIHIKGKPVTLNIMPYCTPLAASQSFLDVIGSVNGGFFGGERQLQFLLGRARLIVDKSIGEEIRDEIRVEFVQLYTFDLLILFAASNLLPNSFLGEGLVPRLLQVLRVLLSH